MKTPITHIATDHSMSHTPAKVNFVTGRMVINPKAMKRYSQKQRDWVILHEMGHVANGNKSEIAADSWAIRNCHKVGLTTKQAVIIATKTLDKNNTAHIMRAKNLLKIHKTMNNNEANFNGGSYAITPEGEITEAELFGLTKKSRKRKEKRKANRQSRRMERINARQDGRANRISIRQGGRTDRTELGGGPSKMFEGISGGLKGLLGKLSGGGGIASQVLGGILPSDLTDYDSPQLQGGQGGVADKDDKDNSTKWLIVGGIVVVVVVAVILIIKRK